MTDDPLPERLERKATIAVAAANDDEYEDPEAARERARELGLDGIHDHPDGDGGTIYMPGEDHARYEEAVNSAAGLRDDWENRLTQQEDPCWDGYTMVGMQDDGSPRCVPDDDVENYDEDKAATEQEGFADYDSFDACVRANSDKDDPEAYCGLIKREVEGKADGVDAKAEFAEGDAVRWSWQGEPVHGRVAEVRPEQATPEDSDATITGDEGESVYLIDEFDDRVEGYRRENVAKPESSLNESRKDLPPRSDDNYVDTEAWDDATVSVRASEFTPTELDHMAYCMTGVLEKLDGRTWATPDGSVVYEAAVPEKYDGVDLTSNAGMQEATRQAIDAINETGNPNGCLTQAGITRMHQLNDGGVIPPATWRDIDAFFDRKSAQSSGDFEGDRTDCSWIEWKAWGGDAAKEKAARVVDRMDDIDQEAAIEMEGAMAARRDPITHRENNRVDLAALSEAEREAVEADSFYVYGKASIEQWDDDDPPTYIQMDALADAVERFFDSDTAPGIISRHHQDIPVGVPVRQFTFDADTTLEIDGETYAFEAGEEARTHVQDADEDGRPELWLAANISNDNEMGKKTRVRALRDELDGFSVTVHRNDDEMTQEGRVVTDVDLHAVTIGTDEQIKNPGSEFDVAGFKAGFKRAAARVKSYFG